jgi:hypothetical protein
VAQANIRLAAGVAVVAAFLLAGGPSAAVAIADSGHGHSGHSNIGNNGKGSDSSGSRSASPGSSGGSDWSDNNITSSSRGGTNSGIDDRPSSRVGSGRDAGTSAERPSSDYSPDPAGGYKPPKVTFGDGRTPGVQDHDPEPRWRGGAPEPAPPPPPEVITVPLNPPSIRPVRQPGVVEQLVVAPTAGLADPLWGVAGLLLIPAAGAILGYRQARAAHAVAELGRHP